VALDALIGAVRRELGRREFCCRCPWQHPHSSAVAW
jgi:hypothetical protein